MKTDVRIFHGLTFTALFVLLAVLVLVHDTDAADLRIRVEALALNTPFLVNSWKAFSVLGSVAALTPITLIVIAMFALRRDWLRVRLFAVAMGGAVLLDISSKWLIHRPRPEEIYANTMPTSFSFPSGHAFYNLIFYALVVIVTSHHLPKFWKAGLWAAASTLIGLISASRVFLGVHYMSDVIGGLLLGAAWVNWALRLSAWREP